MAQHQNRWGDYSGSRSRCTQTLRTWLAEFHPSRADGVGRCQLKVKLIGIITTWIEARAAMRSVQMCDGHDLLREVWGQRLLGIATFALFLELPARTGK